MGIMGNGRPFRDGLAAVSPWATHVRVENQTMKPVLMLLARDAVKPDPADSSEHILPSNTTSAIISGWFDVPRATILMRTGMDTAIIIRASHSARLQISLSKEGLDVFSPDDVQIEGYNDARAVPGFDTVPMMLRKESFADAPVEQDYNGLNPIDMMKIGVSDAARDTDLDIIDVKV